MQFHFTMNQLSLEEREKLKGHICVTIGKARRGAYAREFELMYDNSTSCLKDLGVSDND